MKIKIEIYFTADDVVRVSKFFSEDFLKSLSKDVIRNEFGKLIPLRPGDKVQLKRKEDCHITKVGISPVYQPVYPEEMYMSEGKVFLVDEKGVHVNFKDGERIVIAICKEHWLEKIPNKK